jgi:hypothetical protein
LFISGSGNGCRVLQVMIRHGEPKGFLFRLSGFRILPVGNLLQGITGANKLDSYWMFSPYQQLDKI